MTTWNLSDYNNWIKSGCPVNDTITKLDIGSIDKKGMHYLCVMVDGVDAGVRARRFINANKLPPLTNIENLENLVNLEILICDNNKITSLKGIEKNFKLKFLDCRYNDLTRLDGFGNINLEKIDCRYNNITTLEGNDSLFNLEILNCSDNKLKSLEGIDRFINLKNLNCHYNILESLKGIKKLIKIEILDCSHNKMTTLTGIEKMIKIEILDCSDNKINSLKEIDELINLKKLDCHDNKLINLCGIKNLTELVELNIGDNLLTSLDEVFDLNLDVLKSLYYDNNKIDYVPRNLLRISGHPNLKYKISMNYNTFMEEIVSEKVKKSIINIMKIKPISCSIWYDIKRDDILTKKTKDIFEEHSWDRLVHTTLHITFSELLWNVYDRIQMNVHRDEIKRALNVEIYNSKDKCLTSAMTGLINCLNGYDKLVDTGYPNLSNNFEEIVEIKNAQSNNGRSSDFL
jgi:hypothetical protein